MRIVNLLPPAGVKILARELEKKMSLFPRSGLPLEFILVLEEWLLPVKI